MTSDPHGVELAPALGPTEHHHQRLNDQVVTQFGRRCGGHNGGQTLGSGALHQGRGLGKRNWEATSDSGARST